MQHNRITPSACADRSASLARQGCNWQPFTGTQWLNIFTLVALTDDENSDSGDLVVTSDIPPKKGRGRIPIKKEEDFEEDDDVADAKVINGDADEDEDEDEDDEDMDEDE